MAESSPKAATENDDTPAAEETLDFDDDTLRGEEKRLNADLLGNDSQSFSPKSAKNQKSRKWLKVYCVKK